MSLKFLSISVSDALISGKNGYSSFLFDYLVLIIYMLKILKVSKRKLNQIINNYIEYTEKIRKNIPISIFISFIKTNFNKKTQALYQYVKKPGFLG